MQWLAFLHFYFAMLCGVTTVSLGYLAWLVWPRP
jgi:hypothetical protein